MPQRDLDVAMGDAIEETDEFLDTGHGFLLTGATMPLHSTAVTMSTAMDVAHSVHSVFSQQRCMVMLPGPKMKCAT